MAEAPSADALALASQLAHDFNNLFGILIGASTLVQEDLGNLQTQSSTLQLSEDLISAAREGAAAIEQLAIWAGGAQLTPVPTVLLDVLGGFERDIGARLPPSARLSIEPAAGISADTSLSLDQNALLQILHQLGCNAIEAHQPLRGRFGERDGLPVWIRIACEIETLAGRQHLKLTIEDQGFGMSADTLSRCISPFFSTRRRQGHHGLGLSVVDGYVRQMQGQLIIHSESERGTRVTVSIPESGEPGVNG
ncbi:MAG: sensor histidine kinase [Gammaproteobacteria bacterium]|nr:sensor histidine kinase [Gammaproteobacteria bacterium]